MKIISRRKFIHGSSLLSASLILFNDVKASQIFLRSRSFDIIIKGGYVIDGSGKKEFLADVGIKNGKILEIGNLESIEAEILIDGRGLKVTPGFIDIHSHQEAARLLPVAKEGVTPAPDAKPDWRAIARALEEAQIAWRKLGPVEHTVPRKAQQGENAVTARYAAATQALEAPLREAYRESTQQREQLIAAARNLVGSGARDVIDKVRGLQGQWQAHAKALALPRREENALWMAFKAATDAIFAERDAARAAKESEFSGRLKARDEIIARLGALSSSSVGSEIKRAIAETNLLELNSAIKIDELRKQFAQGIGPLDVFLKRVAFGSKSIDEFVAAVPTQVLFEFARATNRTVTRVNQDFDKMIQSNNKVVEAQQKLIASTDDYNRVLKLLSNMSNAFKEATDAVNRFTNSTEAISGFAKGEFTGASRPIDEAALFQNPEKIFDINKLVDILERNFAQNRALAINAPGNELTIGQQITKDSTEMVKAINALPDILMSLRGTSSADIQNFGNTHLIEHEVRRDAAVVFCYCDGGYLIPEL